MCSRRSMGCVYYGWQMVFVDIINNKTESYIDIVDWTWYIHVMTDTWHLIIYLTWHILYCVLFTLLFIYFIHTIFYSSIYYHHMLTVICTCTFHFILHIHWEFWLPKFAHPSLYMLFTDQVFGEDHTSPEPVLFARFSSFGIFSCFSLLLLLPWFCALDSVLVSFFYSSVIMRGYLYALLHWYWYIILII